MGDVAKMGQARKWQKRTFSEEEKAAYKAECDQRLHDLKDQIASLTNSEQWVRYLTFQSSFHTYSFRNTLLIWLQCPEATYVASFNDWKAWGRYVKKGTRGIRVLAPMYVSPDEAAQIRRDKEEWRRQVEQAVKEKRVPPEFQYSGGSSNKFKYVSVFDYSMTEGNPIPEIEHPAVVSGAELYEKAVLVPEHVGLTYQELSDEAFVNEVGPLFATAKAVYLPLKKRILVKEKYPKAEKAQYLVHELSHWACDHGNPELAEKTTRADGEFEAESTAFVVFHHFGADCQAVSTHYLAHWTAFEGPQDFEQRITMHGKIIQRASRKLIDLLQGYEPALSEASEEAEAA